MLFLIAFVGAAVVALILWRAMNTGTDDGTETSSRPPGRPRVSGPDDDPDFLRRLDERTRRPEEPPA